MSTSPTFIAYYRVSTKRQGASGLGLEAQAAAVAKLASERGATVLGAFTDVETGKRNDRPEMLKALAMCKKHKAVLVIAKLDRLSRNLAFIANLMESGVDFIACDMPHANKVTIQIMAVLAEQEREATSIRTKEALAAAKARGVKLGSPRPGSAQGAAAWSKQTTQHRETVLPIAQQMRSRGLTLRQIAQELNERHIRTANGREWHATTVNRLFA